MGFFRELSKGRIIIGIIVIVVLLIVMYLGIYVMQGLPELPDFGLSSE